MVPVQNMICSNDFEVCNCSYAIQNKSPLQLKVRWHNFSLCCTFPLYILHPHQQALSNWCVNFNGATFFCQEVAISLMPNSSENPNYSQIVNNDTCLPDAMYSLHFLPYPVLVTAGAKCVCRHFIHMLISSLLPTQSGTVGILPLSNHGLC